jgi:hypothetical protein
MAAGDGLISMTPTSITHSGTSATINADGGVDFTAVTSLSLNGVFTSDYDNYLIVIRHRGVSGSGNQILVMRMRAAGSDASGSNYVSQELSANSTTVSSSRTASRTNAYVAHANADLEGGDQIHVYGPALAQPTAFRNVSFYGRSNTAAITDFASTHSLSTAYDGFNLAGNDGNGFTGNVHVFGYEE